ncbi:MAG: adenylate/guanylate cyclase domain-containing protein, partial [Planctomycetota bacterium]
GARYRDFRVAEDGTWTALPEEFQPYDPRTRTWYEEAVAADGPVWSKPFLFASGPPGFILSDAAREKGGQVLGVWGIEYEMAYVSKFLARLEVARHGRAYLVTRAGEVIGHPLAGEEGGDPDDWLAVVEDGKKRIASAQGHRDPWLRAGWRNCKGFCEGERHGRFDLDGETYLTGAKPFPSETGLPWGILIVIPEEDILGEIHRNYLYAALLAALIAGLVIAFGFVYARRRLSDPLTDIAHDLDRLAQLEIDAEPLVREGRLAEVEGMVQARDRVRGGLRSFMKYVPADLVRQLFEAKAQARLGVEECRLTILFSDVADFTSISERLGDPRALVDALESYFEAMSATIAEYGGTVDKYIGDAVMAFWGAPRPLPEHERLALEAAWACQERLGALRAKWEAEGKPPFHTRIGVNTGPAVVGNIGWAQRMNYTAMGDAVNVASRLEGFCKIYGIRIAVSEETYRAGGEGFLARPVDYVSVKGREAPILVYDLLGRKDAASEKTHRFARTIERAFEAYRSRRFAEARALFDEALELRPGDRPAERLRERAAAYEKEPPPEDWAGAVHLDRKS